MKTFLKIFANIITAFKTGFTVYEKNEKYNYVTNTKRLLESYIQTDLNMNFEGLQLKKNIEKL